MKLSDEEREAFLARVFTVTLPEPKSISKPIHTAAQFAAEAERQSSYDDEFRARHGEIF